MKDTLARTLLSKAMKWDELDPDRVKTLQELQILSKHKYDHYERFEPGRKFIECLAAWLEQFDNLGEREIALDFIRRRLVFVSKEELDQLVQIAYPKIIRPVLHEIVSKQLEVSRFRVAEIESSSYFARARRRSLFLGLSDGAKIDEFRRNNRALSHEQVYATYEVAEPRLSDMRDKLIKDSNNDPEDSPTFESVFLIDDFAGSGKTIARIENGELMGKLRKFSDLLTIDSEADISVFAGADTEVHICLYIATNQAVDQITRSVSECERPVWRNPPKVHAVQVLEDDQKIDPSTEPGFCALLDKYYDAEIEDAAKRVGETDSKFGFSGCSLPLVLCHNAPNNSVSLLWAPEPMNSLFTRFERHVSA